MYDRSKNAIPLPAKIWQDPSYFIASGLGIGAIPGAPGTYATLAAIPFYLLLANLPLWLYGLFLLAVFVVFARLSDRISQELGVPDHTGLVLDEFLGFWVTMVSIPPSFVNIVLGFLLFRFFDIVKPWPIRWVDRHLENGYGMMLDDVLAGVFSWVILLLINKI